ncbi:MAG: transposase family protein [Planctomycetia bacterium]|nr:transposase family protein [Planctomycetia bacterium]
MRVLWKDSLESIRQKKERQYRIYPVEMHGFTWKWRYGSIMSEVRKGEAGKTGMACGQSLYTKRFACSVGRKCRTMTVKDVAKDFRLDWDTVKTLDKEYMKKQLRSIQ